MHATQVSTSIISDRAVWTHFSDEVGCVIAGLLPDKRKDALRQNVGLLNNVNQRSKMEAILKAINIAFGPEESRAWKRRNDATHETRCPQEANCL